MPRSSARRSSAARVAATMALSWLVLAAGVAGCARRNPVEPSRTGEAPPTGRAPSPGRAVEARPDRDVPGGPGPERYPLAVGNRWEFSFHMRTVDYLDGVPVIPVDSIATLVSEIHGTTRVGDLDWFVLGETVLAPGRPTVERRFLLREDRAGLHEREVTGADPIAGADAAGVLLLRYPLHAGSSWWVASEDPLELRRVAGRERLHLPAGDFTAWRLDVQGPSSGPPHGLSGGVSQWYADAGLVQVRVRLLMTIYGGSGTGMGTRSIDADQVLTSARLSGHVLRPVAPSPPGRE